MVGYQKMTSQSFSREKAEIARINRVIVCLWRDFATALSHTMEHIQFERIERNNWARANAERVERKKKRNEGEMCRLHTK